MDPARPGGAVLEEARYIKGQFYKSHHVRTAAVYIYIYIQKEKYVCMDVCLSVCTYVYMYVCMYVCRL